MKLVFGPLRADRPALERSGTCCRVSSLTLDPDFSYESLESVESEAPCHLQPENPPGATMLPLSEFVRQELREFVVAGDDRAERALVARAHRVCGPRYAHDPEQTARRAGHARGELVLVGRRVSVQRPRARALGDREVTLPSWVQFAAEDPLHERVLEQMLVGVSTRKHGRSVVAALGIDTEGKKHVLGMRESATENPTGCRALLADLRDRNMRTDRTTLVVIDGSKALAKAVRDVFGRRALIQRCQVHKTRNVLDQLPEDMRRVGARGASPSLPVRRRGARQEALAETGPPSPRCASGRHGVDRGRPDETLTVMRFGLRSPGDDEARARTASPRRQEQRG